jgi:hypothetical protein
MNCILLRRAEDAPKFNPLEDAVLDDITPSIWDGPHVGKRLAEAMRTLRILPMGGAAGYGGTWPPYSYEFEDLLAQQEQGELEKTQRLQNRVRLLPSYSDVTRMEAAICWPAQYVMRHSLLLLRAVKDDRDRNPRDDQGRKVHRRHRAVERHRHRGRADRFVH